MSRDGSHGIEDRRSGSRDRAEWAGHWRRGAKLQLDRNEKFWIATMCYVFPKSQRFFLSFKNNVFEDTEAFNLISVSYHKPHPQTP